MSFARSRVQGARCKVRREREEIAGLAIREVEQWIFVFWQRPGFPRFRRAVLGSWHSHWGCAGVAMAKLEVWNMHGDLI